MSNKIIKISLIYRLFVMSPNGSAFAMFVDGKILSPSTNMCEVFECAKPLKRDRAANALLSDENYFFPI